MACCLTAPSHYLNQCRRITSEELHSFFSVGNRGTRHCDHPCLHRGLPRPAFHLVFPHPSCSNQLFRDDTSWTDSEPSEPWYGWNRLRDQIEYGRGVSWNHESDYKHYCYILLHTVLSYRSRADLDNLLSITGKRVGVVSTHKTQKTMHWIRAMKDLVDFVPVSWGIRTGPVWRGLLSQYARAGADRKFQYRGHRPSDWAYCLHVPECDVTTKLDRPVLITIFYDMKASVSPHELQYHARQNDLDNWI